MIINSPNIFRTARERNQEFMAFKRALTICETEEQVNLLKEEYIDLFAKLRTEKQLTVNWNDYDYLENLKEEITNQIFIINQGE